MPLIEKIKKFIIKTIPQLYIIKLVFQNKYTIVHNYWGKYWKNFYIKNAKDIDRLTKDLKENLTEYDKNLIDLILYRYVFLLSEQNGKNYILYPENVIFNQTEIRLRMNINEYMTKIQREIKLSNRHYEIPVFYYDNGLKFFSKDPRVLSYIKNTIFIDGGAYNGDSAIVFSRYNPKKIIMFEPSLSNIDLIKKTIELNTYLKEIAIIEAYGLGDSESTKNLICDGSASSLYSFDFTELFQKNSVQLTTLDIYCRNFSSRVGLIKLDIEGCEYPTILGGINTINRDRPIMLISIYHTPEDFFYIKPFLEKHLYGYKYAIRKLNPYHPTYETILICYPNELGDIQLVNQEEI